MCIIWIVYGCYIEDWDGKWMFDVFVGFYCVNVGYGC